LLVYVIVTTIVYLTNNNFCYRNETLTRKVGCIYLKKWKMPANDLYDFYLALF
jgi:hypothetical protein